MLYSIYQNEVRQAEKYEKQYGRLYIGRFDSINGDMCKDIDLSDEIAAEMNRKRKYIRRSIECDGKTILGSVRFKDSEKTNSEIDDIIFIVTEDMFLTVKARDENGSFNSMFDSFALSCGSKTQITEIAASFFSLIMRGNDMFIEEYSNKIMKLEESIVSGKTHKNLNSAIFRLKADIQTRRMLLDDLISTGEEMLDECPSLLKNQSDKPLRKFVSRARDYRTAYEYLIENIIHLREVYDAEINNGINSTMKLLSIVSTIFLPLMFIAGWYGMNFKYMPELSWKYGYPLALGVGLAIVAIMIIIFRKKKML